MKSAELVLRFPYGKPLKMKEKETLIRDIISGFDIVGVSAEVKEAYYVDERAETGMAALALHILAATADIVTIAMAIREFLKRRKETKEIRLETESLQLTVNGNMSDDDIIRLVKEARKIIEAEKDH